MTQIQETLIKMLTENTGSHFLDSGGDNNRHWQRNQTKDFLKEPLVTVDPDGWGVTVDLFKYLSEVLDTDEVTDKANEQLHLLENWNDFEELEKFFSDIGLEIDYSVQIKELENTYNFDNFFSQDFSYIGFALTNGSYYVIISSHNGADIRGGYSRPYMFTFYSSFEDSAYYQFPFVNFVGSSYKDLDIEEVTGGGIYTEGGGFVDWEDVDTKLIDIWVNTDF